MARLRRAPGTPRPDEACPDLLRLETLTTVQFWLLPGYPMPAEDREVLERIRPAVEMFCETQPGQYLAWLAARDLDPSAEVDPEHRHLFPNITDRMTVEKFAALVDAGTFDA